MSETQFPNIIDVPGGLENQTMCFMTDDIAARRKNFVDLRLLVDDKTVLKNPHKGWFWHFIDNGYGRPFYRDGYEEDPVLDFPGLNHLYLRFDWVTWKRRRASTISPIWTGSWRSGAHTATPSPSAW